MCTIVSLFSLVILALTTPGSTHTPYRDSKLTRLLQDRLADTSTHVASVDWSHLMSLTTLVQVAILLWCELQWVHTAVLGSAVAPVTQWSCIRPYSLPMLMSACVVHVQMERWTGSTYIIMGWLSFG